MSVACMVCEKSEVREVVDHNRRYFYCAICKKLYERALDSSYGKDVTINTSSGVVHLISGALIKNDDHILIIKRRAYPYGYAFPAGHVEYGENPFDSLRREIMEETGLRISQAKLIFNDEIKGSKCRYGADSHIWYFYECTCEPGTPFLNPESEGIGWYSLEEIDSLKLIPSARFLFENVIKK